jgi:hypothetical protein
MITCHHSRSKAQSTERNAMQIVTQMLSIVFLLLSIACSKAPAPPRTAQLVGTWEQVPDGDPTKGIVVQPKMTFGEDGTLVMELPDPKHPVRDTFSWKLDSDTDGVMHLAIAHEPDGRQEKMAVRMSSADELKVEGKSPATFRRR